MTSMESAAPIRNAQRRASRGGAREFKEDPVPSTRLGAPEGFDRRILLAVTGLTPQILTETLYALACVQHPAWVPTEIHLITTSEGAERARLSLLQPRSGWFFRLCNDYSLDAIHFDYANIHVLTGDDGRPLPDLRTPQDNARAADTLVAQISTLTSDPAAAVHLSIAGGRKTMGFYAGYALSLYGRAQDRLSHVLVSPPYESHAGFYYPTPYSQLIYTPSPDSRPLDTRDARITLAEIPFVRLRHGLSEALLKGRASFSATVAAAQQTFGPPELRIDLAGRGLVAAGKGIPLSPVELALYSMLARRRKAGLQPLRCPSAAAPELGHATDLLSEYRAILGPCGDDERTAGALRYGMDKNFFERHKCRINAKLKMALERAASPYLVQRFGRRPHWRHGLSLPAEAIHFVDASSHLLCKGESTLNLPPLQRGIDVEPSPFAKGD